MWNVISLMEKQYTLGETPWLRLLDIRPQDKVALANGISGRFNGMFLQCPLYPMPQARR